ncbi:adenine deaminase [Halioxenophilus sp. WMMB6]|uniref:adenine deaminase n=1 Tax=Halioxenophilus sp. WMMB6 TaxID=3073815 RepID=UPI00295E462B|nr:adenine deaminase C-terminal domain-containing protein [Halioxenophilus sp. WMMB6]
MANDPTAGNPYAALNSGALGAHYAPSAEDLMRLNAVAAGQAPADLALRGGRVLCLHSKEILPLDVLISGAFIAALKPRGSDYQATTIIDLDEKFIAPSFIDTHLHIEYTLLTPGEFARCVIPKGTGTVLADPNCIGNVLGARAMDWVAETGTPLKIFQQISSRIPRSPKLELGGATVTEVEQMERIQRCNAVSVGESNPFAVDERASRLFASALQLGRRNTGHTARVGGDALDGYIAAGIGDDHNAFEVDEVLDRIRRGVAITVMAGSMNDNIASVFADPKAVQGALPFFSFCADDRHVDDLQRVGHIDHHVRKTIGCGIPELEAYAMASLNAALYYRLDHIIGSVTPARRADLLILDNLAEVNIVATYQDGQRTSESGRVLFGNNDPLPDYLYNTINFGYPVTAADFAIQAEANATSARVRAMEMYDGYFKRAFEIELPVEAGDVLAEPSSDTAKIFVIDRHHATGKKAGGFVRGFGLQRGAIASTTNCENQNMVVLGTNNADMALAANSLRDNGGGYVAVADGEVLAALPLPLAGIMSDQPWESVLQASDEVDAAAHSLGSQLPSPFMILAFVGLAGVPDYGLTELGLIDSFQQEFIPVVVCCRCPQHAHQEPPPLT